MPNTVIYTGPGSSKARDFAVARKGSRTDYTLLSLAGGTYKLETDEEWQELYRLLASDYQQGNPNLFVERKTTVFPLVFDIDFKHSHHDLDWLIEQILPAICRGLLHALATECSKVSFMLSSTPSVPCEMPGGTPGLKSGAHVHFLYARTSDGKLLDVIVDEERAMGIRQCCIEELTKQHGSGMDWETIVDPTVLQDNGLRMLYQLKCTPCMACKKEEHSLERSAGPCPMGEQRYYKCKCPRCISIANAMKRGRNEHGCSFGKVIATRCYMPHGQFTFNKTKNTLRIAPAADYSKVPWDPLEMLQLTSVRLPITDRRPSLKIKVASISRNLEKQLANHNRKRKKGEPRTVMLPTAQTSAASGQEIADSDPRMRMLKELLDMPAIKSNYPDAVPDLSRVLKLKEDMFKLLFVTGYCHNHKGAHTSNRTYFLVMPNRVTQYCYDHDCRGYKNVMLIDTPSGLFM